VLLIVNTASRCGCTPQYEGLRKLHEAYADRGFSVLGFPCNQFGAQEPGSAEEIAAFCTDTYGVTFPMFAKIDVNGERAHPLFAYLTRVAPAETGKPGIEWNFTKFLVDRDGTVLRRYGSRVDPSALAGDIEHALATP
jgi:glutathione peroxidase